MKSICAEQNLRLPSGAFWIENHWKKTKSPDEIPPNRWRSITTDSLLLSGSAIPTLGNLRWIKKNYGEKHPIYILDLRQETHLYIDGLPVSIFYGRNEINWGKTREEINLEELSWIKYFFNTGFISINELGEPLPGVKIPVQSEVLAIKESYSAQNAALKAGLGYFRIEVPDYHPPSPYQVDHFLAILGQLPQNAWVHIHCAAGKGRTTTFMTMRDIVVNAASVSLKDILARQKKLGGTDLLNISNSKLWKREYHQARSHFINLFYDYIHSKAYQKELFSAWIKDQPRNLYIELLKKKSYFQTAI